MVSILQSACKNVEHDTEVAMVWNFEFSKEYETH